MAQTTAAHQKIWCRHPPERKNAGQKSSSRRSACHSPTLIAPIIAVCAKNASSQAISARAVARPLVARRCPGGVLYSDEAYTCRQENAHPRSSQVVLAVECKFYVQSSIICSPRSHSNERSHLVAPTVCRCVNLTG